MREEEKKQPSRKIGIQKFFKKRWVYPAIYIGAAAIILTSFLWFQGRGTDDAEENQFGYQNNPGNQIGGEDALEVNSPVENFKWPVANADDVEVKTPFYDAAASEEEQEAALLSYENSFQPNTGIAVVAKNGETFDVLAALSGTVKAVEQDTVLGNVVIVEHSEGIETRYQSLDDVQVTVGDQVKQGQVLGKAGKSLLNQEAGVHLQFEIRKDDVPVNPLAFFEKSLTTLQNLDVENTESASDENSATEDENVNGEETEDEMQPDNGPQHQDSIQEEDTTEEDANETSAS
ncbi:M23 family metallopeptidase [Caldibacillus lycopersici]|uniref:M23 family metallopeptidase n=1 Tax=Perspicuibacillus lycopersici TaxID=1325689 RepID=A0AAE3IUV0_9BACI|nr:M23 family metallopeptidase [Perspicuibacillus lycopersici]MCU9613289.1 M23 family metallopeptidase [Perspicuibacillus lycopersici]